MLMGIKHNFYDNNRTRYEGGSGTAQWEGFYIIL